MLPIGVRRRLLVDAQAAGVRRRRGDGCPEVAPAVVWFRFGACRPARGFRRRPHRLTPRRRSREIAWAQPSERRPVAGRSIGHRLRGPAVRIAGGAERGGAGAAESGGGRRGVARPRVREAARRHRRAFGARMGGGVRQRGRRRSSASMRSDGGSLGEALGATRSCPPRRQPSRSGRAAGGAPARRHADEQRAAAGRLALAELEPLDGGASRRVQTRPRRRPALR